MAVLLAGALAAASLAATPDAAAAAAPVPAGHTASAGGSSAPRLMSAEQAVAQARSTGKPVVASALTTQTAQTTARPNGTLTLTQTAMPTRVFQHGAWANLDPTLKANPNGTLSPAATMNTVILSGGGRAPLASLYTGGQGFTVTLPVALPHPTYSGPIARYADVIPGVDLTVTVQATGAVSDVFTVRTKSAAHDPRLAGLLDATATTTRGLHIAADSSGGLAVADTRGEPLYTAPAPRGWDSAAAPVPAALARSGAAPDPASSADQPGYGAHTAKLKVTTRTSSIALTAPTALLDAPGTKYPVYLDPTYSPSYGKTGWSSPGSGVAGDNYWDGTVDYGAGDSDAEVGNSGDVQGEAMSLFNMPIALSTLRGAKIYSAYFGIVENHSWACPTSGHDQAVDMYAPSGTLTPSNATWNAWVGSLGSAVGAPNSFALGYNSSCPANGIPPFNVTSVVTNDVSSSKATQTLVMRADDHSDNYAFKEFDPNTAQLTVTYDLYPNTPTGLRTSPATNCTNTILGDTSVSLYAAQSTPTRSALTTTFSLYKTSDSAKTNLLTTANGVASDTWQGASGQSAALVLPESFYKARAGGATTSFSFIAQSTDGTLTSGWSKACTFTWDGTRPGAPGVAPNPSPPGGDQTCATLEKAIGTVEPIGTSCSFNLTPPTKNGTAVAVSGYQYQINQSPPARVTATGSPISVPLTHLVNTLTVSAFSAGGNLGAATTVWFDGTALSPAAKDGDLTSDGTPDLIVPGNTGTAFPPGLWLATGNADGSVAKNAVNIGSEGLSVNSDATPADWNGAQAITGNFCGNGAQDVLAYFPTGANPGGGTIACNDGTNGPLHLGATLDTGSAPYQISSGSLTDANGDNATQAVAAGNTSQQNTGLPDLLATIGTQLVLFYSTTPNGYSSNAASFGMCSGGCYVLSNLASPDGTQDWNNWTIATAQLSTGTAMYLWNSTTGALDLWTGLALDSTKTTLTTTSQLTIATGWNTAPASPPQLRAADLSGTGIPTLWTTDTTGTTTATTPATLSNNPALATATTTTTTASHAWAFQDIGSNTAGDPLTSTADRVGSLALTGTTGAVWNTGDPHTPDALLNTASDGITPSGGTGSLAASGNALDLTNSFTISLWADPNATGAAVLSQDGKTDSGITVAPVAAGWSFSLNTGPGTAWSFDSIVGGTVHLGTWTHLTATYDKTTGVMDLYVDDVFVATGTHTAVTTGATGKLQLGDDQHDSTTAHADYYSGRIADVQTWTGTAVPPVQPYTPASYRQPVTATRILDTRSSNANTDGTATVGASTVHGDSVTTLRIANTGVTSPSGTSVTIPASVTAVAIDVTAANETDAGYVTTYADSTQRPLTSSTNFTANTTVTGYQIVPVGADGKIALYTGGSSTATIALIVDLTGYFTSATLTGDQTYTPLGSAVRALDTGSSIAHTTGLSGTGTVAANTAFTLKITDFVPASATAVAINLTTANETGVGYLAAYATGETPAKLTSLTYNTTGPVASMAADTPIGTGGTITILNNGSATDVLVDISGYYTTTTTGQKFHTTNPTRLVHAATDRIPSNGTYTLTTTDTHQITTATTPTLATMLTVHNTTAAGYAVAYPAGPTMPSTSNLNWASGAIAANLALTPTDNNSQIYIANRSSGTADLIIDCSGYFN